MKHFTLYSIKAQYFTSKRGYYYLLTKVIISGTAYLDKNALITRPLPINLLQTLYYLGTFGIHASMALKRGLASFVGYQLDNSLGLQQ